MNFKWFAVLAVFFLACDEPPNNNKIVYTALPGQINVLNSCGISGAAKEVSKIFRSIGIDVLSIQTDPKWSNYEETIIAVHNPHWVGYGRLKEYLDTKNFIVLQKASEEAIEATIYLGKDYKRVLKINKEEL